ncbi:hypothetical protein PhCBS80983_g00483 [Powellomyces hirtus]|uniref:CHK kinase-like domain-containing protein n=1 Tax=Powellomyces hirtus TaxID=109895 RepID=A0A507EGN7_9FUNG|nr:hypothetical protein PhCBS80983_g00483 [Powellomyces hirtus]
MSTATPATRQQKVLQFLPPRTKIRSIQECASLWAGYGSISRVYIIPASPTQPSSYILKEISVNHERGDRGVGHTRKLLSYQVESTFYKDQRFAQSLLRDSPGVSIPCPLGVVVENSEASSIFSLTIAMSDLTHEFPLSRSDLDFLHATAALRWLAGFHAHFWGSEETQGDETDGQPISGSGLWKEGSYWHLSTRTEEFESIGNSRKWASVKSVAPAIADWLRAKSNIPGINTGSRRFRTVLHGDPKAENILFRLPSPDPSQPPQCAFYDFQYVGYGYGAVDVAYLMATSVNAGVIAKQEDDLIKVYHDELIMRLSKRSVATDAQEYTLDILKIHLGLALVDWVRFMAGWGMWGNVRWVEEKAKETLSLLKL